MSIKNTRNMSSQLKRKHRAVKARECIRRLGLETGIARLTLHRSNCHIYAQILAPVGGQVLACASSLEKAIKEKPATEGGKIAVSKQVGHLIAQRAQAAGIQRVACDRSGFKYHGRIAALVDSARENGLMV